MVTKISFPNILVLNTTFSELPPEILPNAPENLADEDYDDIDEYQAPPQTPRPTHPTPRSPTYSPSSRTRGPSGAFIYRGAGTNISPSGVMLVALLLVLR